MLKISNTLTGKKDVIVPLKPNTINLYVCGITPYDYAHIGHGRVYVVFDVLYRLLTFLGYSVNYCRNFTDIDDKLITKAKEHYNDPLRYQEVAQKFIQAFTEDINTLNCIPPTFEPRVTENIQEIITFIQGLITHKKAYEKEGNVYFSIDTFPEYGKLSKQNLDALQAGSRVTINEEKKNPLDFALWKKEEEGTFWKSPWGYGRPGWHIECSTLARKYLGDQLDIHGGGMDLIFPHHENEIAQSEGLIEKKYSNIWAHCAFVRINKEKMSKSLNNFLTLRETLRTVDPNVLRFYYLTHHYRSPLDFAWDDIATAEKTYQKLCLIFKAAECDAKKAYKHEELMSIPAIQHMVTFLQDDLNIPGMFGVLFTTLHEKKHTSDIVCAIKYFLVTVLGLALQPLPEKNIVITQEIQSLIDQREKYRQAKEWAKADELRKQLEQLGIDLHDKKSS